MTALQDYPPQVQDEIARAREDVCALHAELTRWNLVVWTAGNVSQRLYSADLMVIKPSGVRYDRLTPDDMVVCDLDGVLVDGDHSPSSDTAAHAYVYRHMPEIYGVVHTHSTYATAWAARGEDDPLRADHDGRRVRRRRCRSARSRSSATTRSDAASSRPCAIRARRPS